MLGDDFLYSKIYFSLLHNMYKYFCQAHYTLGMLADILAIDYQAECCSPVGGPLNPSVTDYILHDYLPYREGPYLKLLGVQQTARNFVWKGSILIGTDTDLDQIEVCYYTILPEKIPGLGINALCPPTPTQLMGEKVSCRFGVNFWRFCIEIPLHSDQESE